MASSASKSTAKKKSGKSNATGLTKSDVILSVLASFVSAFSFFIVGPLSFYFSESNKTFFENNNLFTTNVVTAMVVAAVVLFVVLAAILLLATKKMRKIMASVLAWLLVGGYIQSFMNSWTGGLIGDGNAGADMPGFGIPNLLMWLALGFIIIGGPIIVDRLRKAGKKVPEFLGDIISKYLVTYLLILVFVMQGVGFVEVALKAPADKSTTAFLSADDMFEVSENDNVIVFLVDRFDSSYYKELKDYDADFFKDFDGFTSYTDNISLYGRTYPAVTSILTNIENDFSKTRTKYFEKAYGSTTFLPDMKANGYDINLYTTNFYVYSDAAHMSDYVDNVARASDTINFDNPMGLVGAMAGYSVYNSCPDLFKKLIPVSTNSFTGLASQDSKAQMYEHDDAAVYDAWQEAGGLTTKKNNQMTFIHLRGCHSPFNVDENMEYVGDYMSTSLQQTRGVFKLIKEYIADLKAKGLYDNATIIITGDHASALTDTDDVPSPRITALLVKEKGKSGTPMTESSAPVCQANLIPTIVKSAGITPSVSYGRAYSEIGEDEVLTRKYLCQKTVDSSEKDEIVEYSITGPATDFSNWIVKERHVIGNIYK